MTIDPWKPPSGWDRVELEATDGPWTIGRVFAAMGRAFRGQPLGVLLAVCVLPGIWEVPATIVRDQLIPGSEPMFGPGRAPLSTAVSFGTMAWSSVWAAGQLSAALDAMRGQPIRWRAFLGGLSRAPILFLTTAVIVLPFELVALLPLEVPRGEFFSLFDAVGLPLFVYLCARTCLWTPLLVDARRSFWEGLTESWVMTWGSVTKLVVLGGILLTATMAFLIVETAVVGQAHAATALSSAAFTLAVAAVYTFIDPGRSTEPAASPSISASPSPEP